MGYNNKKTFCIGCQESFRNAGKRKCPKLENFHLVSREKIRENSPEKVWSNSKKMLPSCYKPGPTFLEKSSIISMEKSEKYFTAD